MSDPAVSIDPDPEIAVHGSAHGELYRHPIEDIRTAGRPSPAASDRTNLTDQEVSSERDTGPRA